MHFASDNASPAHPRVMDALVRANEGYMPSYGTEPLMDEVAARIRDIFEAPEAAVYLVATGSTANALSLACLAEPWSAIFCHRLAHVEEDECNAPEFYTGGAKITLVDGANGRIDPDELRRLVRFTGRAGVHNPQRGPVSLTNVTEVGTAYSVDEVETIARIAGEHSLPVHMDGARFANALAATGAAPADMTWRAGVDILSFGGTKNGLMGVEAVVIFDPARAWEFELRRKRGGHLFSKHRYLAAQMLAYLEDDLWLSMARSANEASARLAEGLRDTDGVRLVYPTEANMVFAALPRALHRKARAGGAQYHVWPGDQPAEGPDDEPLAARFVCSWCTGEEEVDSFLAMLRA